MISAARFTWIRIPDLHAGNTLRLLTVLAAAGRLVRRTLCGLGGHEMVLRYEPDRLALECLNCGAQTAGWKFDVRPAFRSRAPARARVARLSGAGPARAAQLPASDPEQTRKAA